MYILLNGELVKKEEATISPFDHGYMYGLGVFETLRVYDGHPFLFMDHIERLKAGMEALNIDWEIDNREILNQLQQLLQANEYKDAYVRINVSAGQGDVGLQVEPYQEPTFIIYMKPLSDNQPKIEKEAIFLETKRNSPEGNSRLKSHHFLNNVLGKRELGADPTKEGIFLNYDGHVSEGVVSNIFWLKQNTLYTPSVDTGILNGITRQFIIKLANQLGYQVEEGKYMVGDLQDCDEAFISNSIQEIVPLKCVSKRALPGFRGNATSKLIHHYDKIKYNLWSRSQLSKGVL